MSLTIRAAFAILGLIYSAPSAAQTVQYLLGPGSQITHISSDARKERTVAKLQGSFDLTVLPIPDALAVEAVTGVRWYSKGFRISGAGFFQRRGRNRISLVLDAVVNGERVLLTSSAHPTHQNGGVRMQLTSQPDAPISLEIDLIATPSSTDGPDADRDGIPDIVDLCPNHPVSRQDDSDGDSDIDGVGDACDECPETPLGDPVLPNGCSPEQLCPCDGPSEGELWRDKRSYVGCVARVLKKLANHEELTRAQVRTMVQKAVRSGCGQPIIAMR